jgi:N-dimethylarginine dimethylaminohydrolase
MTVVEDRETLVDADLDALEERVATPKTVLMCRPEHFTVSYRINPWMEPANPTDTGLALRQWQTLYDTYQRLGFHVELIDPIAGLPDMVYAANGGFVLDGIAYGARFHYPERGPEGPAYSDWFAERGLRVVDPVSVNEGEGDFLKVGETIFAGTGFRSDTGSHAELARIYDREVVTLRLVDPSFYHLDTAFAVLDDRGGPASVAYLPRAFDDASRAILERRFPDAVLATDRRRCCARPQLVQRRAQRRHRGQGEDFRPRPRAQGICSAWSGPVRAAARRRGSEVLHTGAEVVTMAADRGPRTSADYIALDEQWGAHNYHPLPVVAASAPERGSPTSRGDATWTASPATRR